MAASRIRDSFQVEIWLRDVFEAPTLEELGLLIVQCRAEQVADGWELLDRLEGLS